MRVYGSIIQKRQMWKTSRYPAAGEQVSQVWHTSQPHTRLKREDQLTSVPYNIADEAGRTDSPQQLGVVTHTCNPSLQKAVTTEPQVPS